MSLIRSTASKRTLGLFASILLGPGCVATHPNAPPVRDNSPVQTDSLVYHLERRPSEYRAYVTATFTNKTSSPVYFARCNDESQTPMFGIRRTGPDSTKALFSDFAWACVGGVPTGQIPPGGKTTVRVPVGERGSAGDAATAQARGPGGLNASQLPVAPKLFSGLGRLRCDARDGTDLKRLPGNVLGALAVMPNERCSRQALFGCDFVAMVVTCLQLN